MNLKITTSTPISIGGASITNLYGTITQHAYDNPDTGGLVVPCDLKWWVNETAFLAGKDQVWPIANNSSKLAAITVDLTANEAAAAGLPYTIYLKAADAIMLANPTMTVTVIL